MRFLLLFVEFLFPRRCLGCKTAHTFLCTTCLAKIPVHEQQHCPQCLRSNSQGAVCVDCRGHWHLDGLFVVAQYTQKSLLQTCIKTMKYGCAYRLGTVLGDWMAHSARLPSDEFIIVPVPLHKIRERKRGYNQARLLADRVSRGVGMPVVNCIERQRNTPPQARLSRDERLLNLRHSFDIKGNHDFLNKKVVLIDDVCSTGATLNECAQVLTEQGVDQIWGLVLARG